MRITSLLIMMIASLGIVCQADAATRCAPCHVADRGASVASMNAVGESVSLPDFISLHSDHISFNSDTESYRDYSGGYTYLNGTLERVETPVGYIHSHPKLAGADHADLEFMHQVLSLQTELNQQYHKPQLNIYHVPSHRYIPFK